MDEINKEITDLRCENRKLHGELARLQQQASTDQSSQNHEQTHQSLMRDSRLKKLHQFMAVDLERQVKQSKELNGRLVAAEDKIKELQKKYDESKKTYFQLQDSRARLRTELDKLKGTSANAGEASEGMTSAAGVCSPDMSAQVQKSNSVPSGDINQKYEHLKTKFRVSSPFSYRFDTR